VRFGAAFHSALHFTGCRPTHPEWNILVTENSCLNKLKVHSLRCFYVHTSLFQISVYFPTSECHYKLGFPNILSSSLFYFLLLLPFSLHCVSNRACSAFIFVPSFPRPFSILVSFWFLLHNLCPCFFISYFIKTTYPVSSTFLIKNDDQRMCLLRNHFNCSYRPERLILLWIGFCCH
jgi:hypothetical protein